MAEQTATVTATYSRRMRLRFDDGTIVDARIKGKKLKPVCGDEVVAEPIPDERDWLITSIVERSNELSRPNARGEKEVLAANIDLLVVVAAALPSPDWFVVDRYLCAAESMGVDAAILYNKTDLDRPGQVQRALQTYRDIGYPVLETSAIDDPQLAAVADLLRGHTAIIVGQSGVGKSTLINALSDVAAQRTATISSKHREGKHTTVNSVMIPLPDGGQVIDSPGVRDYAPYLSSPAEAGAGFREVVEHSRQCRFANCRHLREPGCAVKAAVEAGGIDARRYESFRRILALTEKLERERRS